MSSRASGFIQMILHKLNTPLGAYQFFQASRQLFVVLISIILVKHGLESTTIGWIELHFYIATLLSLIWLRPLLQYMLYEDQYDDASIFVAAFKWMNLFILTLFGFYLIGQKWLDHNLFHSSLDHLLPYFVFFAGCCLTYLDITRLYRVGSSSQIYGLTLLLGILHIFPFVALYLGGGITLTFQLLGIGGLLLISVQLTKWQRFKKTASQIPLNRIRTVALPLALYAIISLLPPQFDAWLVQYHYSDSSLFAIFRYGARELPILLPLLVSLSQVAVPRLQENTRNGLLFLKSKMSQYLPFISLILCILLLLSNNLFRYFYSTDFDESVILFDLMLIVIFSKFLAPQSIIIAREDNPVLYRIGAAELVINVLLSLLLIRHWGLAGVVFATILAYYFEKIFLMIFVRRRYGIKPNQYLNVLLWSICLGTFVILFTLKHLV